MVGKKNELECQQARVQIVSHSWLLRGCRLIIGCSATEWSWWVKYSSGAGFLHLSYVECDMIVLLWVDMRGWIDWINKHIKKKKDLSPGEVCKIKAIYKTE